MNREDYFVYIGKTFNRLTIKRFIFVGKTKAVCHCSCGKEITVVFNNLRHKTKSCGCLRSEQLSSKRKWTDEQKQHIKKQREKQKKRWLTKEYKDARRKWVDANRERINSKKLRYHNMRLKDPVYLLKRSIRNRFKAAIRNLCKSGSAVDNLGCSIDELKSYLESKFQPGMTWINYGKGGWHIDHIKPLSSFDLTKIEELREACNYKNLQPLWAKDNLMKGSKYD